MSRARIVVATRKSALALAQSRAFIARLAALYPAVAFEELLITTTGDVVQDRALADIGGKGLFVKEIEEALLDGRAEVAVHSMKDLPAEIPDGLMLGAVPVREDARDALIVAPKHDARDVMSLPNGARVGTSSLRRVCQLKARRPDLALTPLRGNVDTRLGKVEAGELDAIVLACAGLKRLGHGARITAAMSTAESLPAIGQGALAIECRVDDPETLARLQRFDDRVTAQAVAAERAFLKRLSGDCKTPLAAHATVDGARLVLEGLVGAPDGSQLLRERLEGAASDGADIGRALAEALLHKGADRLLAFTTTEIVGGE